ncbi:MAG TPA: hypothetical protein VHR66_33070 [Gemmataceae bacterium]|jgi:hypothetical protein|nr:hypothetical protein [Gemmataceae bacterium]
MPAIKVDNTEYDVQYGSQKFDPVTTETLHISGKPQYDSSGRTIIYVRWNFVFRTIIYAAFENDTTIDFQMNAIRQILMSPGNSFRYVDRGLGDLCINSDGPQRDVSWGPKPQFLEWEPWGDANVAQVTWGVEVCIPECNSAKYQGKVILEWNYSMTYERDVDGFTTRRINGHVVIPQTRQAQGNRNIVLSADEFREKIYQRPLPGFRPLAATFKLSEDKCRLEYSFGDEEMGEDIPPPGVIRIDASMSSGNDRPYAMKKFTYNFNATYTVARGFPLKIAAAHFQRITTARQAAAVKAAGGKKAIVVNWHPGEPRIYGKAKQASYSITFAIVRDLRRFYLAPLHWAGKSRRSSAGSTSRTPTTSSMKPTGPIVSRTPSSAHADRRA